MAKVWRQRTMYADHRIRQKAFSYYGSKSKLVHCYPPPEHDVIVEPFAGTASYSQRYFDRSVMLYDLNPAIVEAWEFLIGASRREIMSLPFENDPSLSLGQRTIVGSWLNQGTCEPWGKQARTTFSTKGMGSLSQLRKTVMAKFASHISHWKVFLGTYRDVPDVEATWFIDPPYQFGGEHYTCSSTGIDWEDLVAFCRNRGGLTILCENSKQEWFPESMRKVRAIRGANKKRSVEMVWVSRSSETE